MKLTRSEQRIAAEVARVREVMSAAEVGALIQFTRKGVYGLVEQRRIPFIRIGNRIRFLREDVLAWLRESRVLPSPR
jgi:excisionase family DNA binding protein